MEQKKSRKQRIRDLRREIRQLEKDQVAEDLAKFCKPYIITIDGRNTYHNDLEYIIRDRKTGRYVDQMNKRQAYMGGDRWTGWGWGIIFDSPSDKEMCYRTREECADALYKAWQDISRTEDATDQYNKQP